MSHVATQHTVTLWPHLCLAFNSRSMVRLRVMIHDMLTVDDLVSDACQKPSNNILRQFNDNDDLRQQLSESDAAHLLGTNDRSLAKPWATRIWMIQWLQSQWL